MIICLKKLCLCQGDLCDSMLKCNDGISHLDAYYAVEFDEIFVQIWKSGVAQLDFMEMPQSSIIWA